MTDPREELAGRLFEAGLNAVELMTVYLGDALGLYRALRDYGGATVPELAARAGIAERYAQEWLEGQAASGLLEVNDPTAAPAQRRFRISESTAEVLIDRDSPYSLAPLARLVGGLGSALPRLVGAFRTGDGIPWSEYGPDVIEAQGDFNRPWLRASLGTEYLPAVPDVHAKLSAGPARVADVACGTGWAAIAIAQAYPQVSVDAYDEDEYTVELARKHVAEAGLAGRVNVTQHDMTRPVGEGSYDLAVVIEAVHDLPRPVEFLHAVRQLVAPGGVAIVADEKAGETFAAPADEMERFFYAASVLCCLPAGLAEQPSAATGTVIRPTVLRRYATEAGFRQVSVLDEIAHDMFRFYRLDP